MSDSEGKSRKWMYVYGVIAAAAIGGAAAATLVFGRAEVEGQTPRQRIASIRRLAHRKPLGAGRAIADAAADPDAAVRKAAMNALRNFIRPGFRPAVEAGTRDADPGVRAAAAAALALYADNAAADRLGEMLAEDPDRQVRLEAVLALGRCNAKKALVLLVQNMEKGDNIVEVRVQAAKVLAGRYRLDARDVHPRNVVLWLNFIETIKLAPGVEDAFASVGEALEHHPEHLIPMPKEH